MKMKTQFSMQTIRKYLRELSIVVAGIAITFGINNLINNKNSKKDLKQYLNIIQVELKMNIEEIDNEINILDNSISYTRYLQSHNKELLNSDTIQKYRYTISQIRDYKPKYNAFEMFKSSGSMRLITNKELLLSIWEAYDEIDNIHSDLQAYYQYKKDKFEQEVELKESDKLTSILLYNFFISGYDIDLQKRNRANLEELKETVVKIVNFK
jgi:hypothetical protein